MYRWTGSDGRMDGRMDGWMEGRMENLLLKPIIKVEGRPEVEKHLASIRQESSMDAGVDMFEE